MANILITGATGFIGSAFITRLLHDDEGGNCFALMRERDNANDASVRLNAGLARALHASHQSNITSEQYLKRIEILKGDTSEPLCALSDEDIAKLSHHGIDQIWHIAGELKSHESPELATKNIASAKALSDLADKIGRPHVVYVSTAYVFGAFAGTIANDAPLPKTVQHNNLYEASKFETEKELTRLCAEKGLCLTVMRPTIVIGSTRSKSPAGSTSGLYGVIHTIHRDVQRRTLEPGETVQINAGKGALNLVSIDHVVDAMLRVAQKPATAPLTVQNITGSDISVETVVAALSQGLGVDIKLIDNDEQIAPQNARLNRQLDFFRPYTATTNVKAFAVGPHLAPSEIYDIDVLNYVEACLAEARFGNLQDAVRIVHIERSDASPIIAYQNRDFDLARPTVVIVNAYGMPVDVMHPLVHDLINTDINVISWQCRGLPDMAFDVTNGGLTVEDHLQDWKRVRAHFGITTAGFVGWSTGAVVASRIAAADPDCADRLVLLNGSFMHQGLELTLFQENLKSIMPKVAMSRQIAKVLYKSVFSEDRGKLLQLVTRDIVNKSKDAMSVTKPAHNHLVEMLTAGPEEVFRYARLIRDFVKEDITLWLADVQCETTIITGTEDITAHPKGSYDIAERMPAAHLHVVDGADHLSIYSSPQVRRLVTNAVIAHG